MGKKRDMAWAEEMRSAFPPVHYSISLNETMLFLSLEDPLYGIAAAYNYGFKRGQMYREKKRHGDKGLCP